MNKPKIMFDKTEIVANATVIGEMNKKSQRLLRLSAESFSQILFIPCTERKFFRKIDSEKIVLSLRNLARPVEYTKKDNAVFFESYKESFAKFAKDNGVLLIDETKKQ